MADRASAEETNQAVENAGALEKPNATIPGNVPGTSFPITPPFSEGSGSARGRRTYAIADLHGRFDLLTKAYDAISLHSAGEPITIVHLGDYVDRGPQSREVIDWLMEDAALPPWVRRVCLQGNHEAMMLETIRRPLHPEWWIGNGGGATLISYGHERSGAYTPEVVPVEHLDWIASRPLFHADQHRLFVHAGVRSSLALDDQPDEILQWMIWPEGAEDDYRGLHIVHGHEQFADGPKCFAGRTDLDTFAWYTGRLVIGVFEDSKPGGPADFIEVTGDPSEHALSRAGASS